MMYQEPRAQLENEPHSAYVLSLDLRILAVNAAYHRFALENGGAVDLDRWNDESTLTA